MLSLHTKKVLEWQAKKRKAENENSGANDNGQAE
jgi:hypothetical protein